MGAFERFIYFLNRVLLWVATVLLGAMILLTCANIFLRVVWLPVRGTFELMGYGGAVITAFALGYTQWKRGHIAVDILVLAFPDKIRRILNGLNSFILMVFFAMITWQIAKYATILRETGELTETLMIIYYPFTYAVALGCAALSLVFLSELLKFFIDQEKETK